MLLYTHKVAVSGRVYLWVFAIVFPAFPQLFQLSISSKKSVPPAAACLASESECACGDSR